MRKFFLIMLMVLVVGVLIFDGCAKPATPPAPTPAPAPAPTPAPAPAPTPAPAPAPTPAPTPAPAPAPAPKKIILRFADEAVTGALRFVQRARFIKQVNDRAKGELEIIQYPDGQIAKRTEIHTLIATGVVEMGGVSPVYAMGVVPEMEGTIEWVWGLEWDTILDLLKETRPIVEEAYAKKNNTKLVAIQPMQRNMMWTINTPLDKADSVKGLKMRSPGGVFAPLFKGLGAIITAIAVEETYMALEKRTVDGMTMTADTTLSLKFYEVVHHLLVDPPTVVGNNPIMMNLNVWNRLPAHLQQVFIDVAKEWEPWALADARRQYDEDVKAVEAKGVKTYKLSPEERARYYALIEKPETDFLISLLGQEQATKILNILAKYRK